MNRRLLVIAALAAMAGGVTACSGGRSASNITGGLPQTYALTQQATPAPGNILPGVAPTIHVMPGDTIVIDLVDSLPQPGRKGDMNLHFHGLTVSPKKPADDVVSMLAMPGDTLHYVVPIPKTQQPGLYWYHPHVFPETDIQVGQDGMSGAIVVDGLEKHYPQLAKMKEHVIIVRATGLADINARQESRSFPHLNGQKPCGADPGYTISLNGVQKPIIPMQPNEQQFFRVINAEGHKTLRLAVDNSQMQLVATDGVALDEYPGNGPTEVSSIVLPVAARAEFVVTAPPSGETKFRTLCFDAGPAGDEDPNLVLGTIPVKGGGAHEPRRTPVALRASGPWPNAGPLPAPVTTRMVTLSEDDKQMYINGKHFQMGDPPMFTVKVGTVEKWIVNNVTDEIHDFHIHQVHFVLKEIDGHRVRHPYWADSVVVPHQKDSVPGTITILMDFRDPIIRGTFMFHCHILDHEDSGMMAKIRAI
jgi:FtsP/CotA-like multicopper oxidase with cupredoxin domain